MEKPIYTARRPFDHTGEVERNGTVIRVNGMIQAGDRMVLPERIGAEYARKRLVYATKENKKAYIVHLGGSWFEVRYGDKVQKVQGKSKAEAIRDDFNS